MTQDLNQSEPELIPVLADLLPKKSTIANVSESTSTNLSSETSAIWPEADLAKARLGSIRRYVKAGWKWLDGVLKKGQVAARPSTLMPFYEPHMAGWNPREHAFPIRLGATFVGDNRYAYQGHVMDRSGAFRDPDECPECSSTHGEYRYRVPIERLDPREAQRYTFCRRCISPEERDELHLLATNPERYDEMIQRRKQQNGRPPARSNRPWTS